LPDRQIHYVPPQQVTIDETRAEASRQIDRALLCLTEQERVRCYEPSDGKQLTQESSLCQTMPVMMQQTRQEALKSRPAVELFHGSQ
jgi:hypothetical protein